MQPNIGIKKDDLACVAEVLGHVLADEFLLYTKTRNAHWNVEGPDFHDKHKFFEAQYEELDEIMDEVAERMRILGHYAPGTLKDFLQLTHLTEASRSKNDSLSFIKELLNDHENIAVYLREHIDKIGDEYHDVGTSDFLTAILEQHEKMAWMLRAHVR